MMKNQKELPNELYEFIRSLEKNGIISNVSMMRFIQSKDIQLADLALPLIRISNSQIVLKGAILFHQGKNTGKKLDKDQVRMVRLLLGKDSGRQRLTGHISGKGDQSKSYAMYIKKVDSKITVKPKKNGLPVVNFDVLYPN